MSEVARRADVGNATVYRHFATRRELTRQVTLGSISVIADDRLHHLAGHGLL